MADLGAWTPRDTVSVVIPTHGRAKSLAATLAALDAQTYPAELVEVLVVDDGSDPPVVLEPTPGGREPTLLRQEREGFGAGRARNLGASRAMGEVLLFLDADVVAQPQLVEAHARWHAAAADALVIGPRRFVLLDEVSIADVAAGRIAELAEGHLSEWQGWLEPWLVQSADLTAARGDLFTAVISANLSMRSAFFHALGGFTSFGRRGIEDTELGWRAFVEGALLVPDRAALGWHLGHSHFMGSERRETKRRRLPLAWHYLPGWRGRPRDAARRFLVPRVIVEVEATGYALEPVVDCVDAILGGELRDVAVVIRVGDDEAGMLVREALAPDARIIFDGDGPHASPVRMRLPRPLPMGPQAVAGLVSDLEQGRVGVVRATVQLDDEDSSETIAVAWRERARRRGARVFEDRLRAGSMDLLEEPPTSHNTGVEEAALNVAEELFGLRRVSGRDYGLGVKPSKGVATVEGAHLQALTKDVRRLTKRNRRLKRELQEVRAQADAHAARAQAESARAERMAARSREEAVRAEELGSRLTSVQARKVIRVADGVGRLRRRVFR